MEMTRHVYERYAERVMNYEERLDINRYITLNEQSIKERIEKMIEYSEEIYAGKIRDHDFARFMYNKQGWVIILNRDGNKAITLYKNELFEDEEELNKHFLEVGLSKVNDAKKDIIEHDRVASERLGVIGETIKNNEQEIKNLENIIKNLKAENQHLIDERGIISSKRTNLVYKLNSVIEKFIGAKVF